ncbi:MAG: hypothetical protein PHU12_03580 [Candidatus Aenigmarchaeota archaeon]|nr:hypothetical protein [Candidatus Aenigmarchaeota archaeon]
MKNVIILGLMLIVLTQVVYAVQLSDAALEAQTALEQSSAYIEEMARANFSTNKVNDTYLLAKQDFDTKSTLEGKLFDVSYDTVLAKTSEIKTLRDKAFSTYDELLALQMYLEPYRDKNLTETFALYDEAKEEFEDERYDEAAEYIQQTYDKIIEEQSAQSTLKAFYDNTRKTIRNFIIENWHYILLTIAIVTASLIIGYNRLSRYLIKRKIKHLELEKIVLKELIKDTQDQYFDKGKISETDYHIKVKKFGELIRDIERQVPLLQEQLAKISKPERTKRKSK